MKTDTEAGTVNYNPTVSTFLLSMPVAKFFGLKAVEFGLGKSVIELPFKMEFTYDGKIIQGGIVGALADFAGASAAMTLLPVGWVVMTTGFEVHNVAPALAETLLGVGEVIKPGKNLAVSRADVFAIGNGNRQLCATALVTTRGLKATSS